MNFIKRLFIEQCPKCNKALETSRSNTLKSIVVKSCPDQHYQKEFHPALETYVETYHSL
jgi:hypothetical protein